METCRYVHGALNIEAVPSSGVIAHASDCVWVVMVVMHFLNGGTLGCLRLLGELRHQLFVNEIVATFHHSLLILQAP